jgi:thiamine phosphate phosphatase / amino-HMP aminohydrolase
MSIILDFDGTITAKDTIGELAKFALRTQAELQSSHGGNSLNGNDSGATPADRLKSEWDAVVAAYMADYDQHVREYHVAEAARTTREDEVAFLRAAKGVELRSLDRIHACGVFRGVDPARFRAGGRAAVADGVVRLRPGFRDFVDARLRDGWRVFVVSVNWSTAFIEGAIDCPGVTVVANHVRDADGHVVGPEVLRGNPPGTDECRNLTNSLDKLEALQAALLSEDLLSKPTFYFGDSITDLECLLFSSHGVVIADKDNSTLLETLRRIGHDIPVPHAKYAKSGKREDGMCWASDYDEVMSYISFDK